MRMSKQTTTKQIRCPIMSPMRLSKQTTIKQILSWVSTYYLPLYPITLPGANVIISKTRGVE